MRAVFIFGALALVISLSACEKINWETHIFHTKDLEKLSVITDAKQRLVINRETADGKRMICAEPSPDVAQAFSEAMKIAASVSASRKGADGSDQNLDAEGSFARSYAGAVAQLGERLAVVQLLRDEMYRACEGYANGALTKVSYTLKLARLDKKMATLLSSEMAAGAFGRKLASIGSSSNVGGVDAEELKKAEATAEEAINQLEALGKKDGTPDKEIEKQKETAIAAIDNLVSLQNANARLAASASAEAGGGLQVTVSAEASKKLAEIHRNYLDDTGVEPLIDTCVTAMSNADFSAVTRADQVRSNINSNKEMTDSLRDFIENGFETEKQANELRKQLPKFEQDENLKLVDGDLNMTKVGIKETEQLIADFDKKTEELISEFKRGDAFSVQCINTFMSNELANDGFISRMIKSKKELRQAELTEAQIKATTDQMKVQLALQKHQVCVEAAKLLKNETEKQKALAKCAN